MNKCIKVQKYNELSEIHYEVLQYGDGISEIDLRSVFKIRYRLQPWMMDAGPCIYLATCLITGKVYVGQAKNLFGRWVNYNLSHLNEFVSFDTYFIRALKKYKSRNFKLEVLEDNIPKENLNEREIYWVEFFGAYGPYGYNMNSGGGNTEHLNSPEIQEVASYNKSISRILNYHSDFIGDCKSCIEIIEQVGIRNFQRHMERLEEKIDDIRLDPRWTPEFERMFKDYKGFIYDTTYSKVFSSINTKLLSCSNPTDAEEYYHLVYERDSDRHIVAVFNHMPGIFKDIRWTSRMSSLFSNMYDYIESIDDEWAHHYLAPSNPFKSNQNETVKIQSQ